MAAAETGEENMEKKRKIIACILVVLLGMLVFLAGCSGRQAEPDPEEMPDEPAGTVLVTDSIGRTVEVPVGPKRLATLYAYSGHVVTLLGHGDSIVAVNRGLQRDILFNRINDKIATAVMPVVSGNINIEELLAAKPDLAFVQGNVARDEKETEKLDKAGITYLAVDYNTIEEQIYTIDMIGKAIGAEEAAAKYIKYYRDMMDLVSSRVADIPEEEKVRVYHSVNQATRTYGRDNLAADWTQLAGAINVTLDQELRLVSNEYYATLEQILLWDPDIILVNEDGVADYIMTNSQWSPLQAVKNKRVYQMPVGVSRWGHPGSLETPLGLLYAAKLFYPDRFADIDIPQITREYYREFFRYELSDSELEDMLSGRGMREAKQ